MDLQSIIILCAGALGIGLYVSHHMISEKLDYLQEDIREVMRDVAEHDISTNIGLAKVLGSSEDVRHDMADVRVHLENT